MSNLRAKLGLPTSSSTYKKITFISSTGYGFTDTGFGSEQISISESIMTKKRLSYLLEEDAEDNPLPAAPAHKDNTFAIIKIFTHSYIIESDETLYVYTEDKQKANIVRNESNIVYLNAENVDVIVYTEKGYVVECTKNGVCTFNGVSSKPFPIPDAFPLSIKKRASFLERCIDAGLCVRHPPSIDMMHEITEDFINWRAELRPFEKKIIVLHAFSLCDQIHKLIKKLEDEEGFVSSKEVHEGLLLRDRLECLLMFDLSDEEELLQQVRNIDYQYEILLRTWAPPKDDVKVNIDERLWMAESGDLNTYWGGSNLQ